VTFAPSVLVVGESVTTALNGVAAVAAAGTAATVATKEAAAIKIAMRLLRRPPSRATSTLDSASPVVWYRASARAARLNRRRRRQVLIVVCSHTVVHRRVCSSVAYSVRRLDVFMSIPSVR
jgi:hypothetical protein